MTTLKSNLEEILNVAGRGKRELAVEPANTI